MMPIEQRPTDLTLCIQSQRVHFLTEMQQTQSDKITANRNIFYD